MPEVEVPKKPEPSLPKRFYSVRDAAHYLGVSEQHIYNCTSKRSGKSLGIPFRRIGKRILFDIRDLEKV